MAARLLLVLSPPVPTQHQPMSGTTPMKIQTTSILRLPAFRIPPEACRQYGPFVENMWQVMRDNKGIGLAAPQVGEALSIAVIDVFGHKPLVMFNPEVVAREGRRLCVEGCLSLPGEQHRVYRARSITVCYNDFEGNIKTVRARKNLLAQALEHEVDHLRGVLIDGKTRA